MAGRPAKYTDAEKMQLKADLYFDGCEERDKAPTVAGLALALGFVNRQSLLDYEGRSEAFSGVIKRARTRIEHHHEERLSESNSTGSIFWLKAHAGLRDTLHVDSTSSDGSMSPRGVDASKLSKGDLAALMEIKRKAEAGEAD